MLFDYWHCGSMTDRNVAAPHAQTPVRLAGLSDEAAAAAAVLRMLVRLVVLPAKSTVGRQQPAGCGYCNAG